MRWMGVNRTCGEGDVSILNGLITIIECKQWVVSRFLTRMADTKVSI